MNSATLRLTISGEISVRENERASVRERERGGREGGGSERECVCVCE